MYIRVNDPSLNRNVGNFQLLHIWHNVLQDTPTLHLGNTLLLPSHNGQHTS